MNAPGTSISILELGPYKESAIEILKWAEVGQWLLS